MTQDTQPQKPLSEVLLGGAAWMMAMRWGVRLIGLASTVILARLLMPEDFGVVAMAMVCVGLLEQLLDFGLEFGLLRNPHAERKHYDTTWTIRLLQMGAIAIILALAAPLIASGYGEPRVMPILWVVALGGFVRAWENIGTIDFRKHLQFDKDFRFNIYLKFFGFVVTVSLALYFRSYWALVIGTLCNHCVAVVLSYVMSAYRPRFSLEAGKEVLSFSQWMLVRGLANYAFGRTDEFVIGKLFGSVDLGHYAMAKNVSAMVTAEIVQPASRALVPGFSKFENQPTRLAAAFSQAVAAIATLVIPAGLGLACVAPEVVEIFLGSKWVNTVPMLQAVPLGGVVMALHSLAGNLIVVIGRVKAVALVAWIRAIFMLICVGWGYSTAGLYGIVYGAVAGTVVSFVALNSAAVWASEVTWSHIVGALVRPVVSGALMGAAIYAMQSSLVLPALAMLGAKMAVGALVYVSVLGLLWYAIGGHNTVEVQLFRILQKKLGTHAAS